MPSVKSFFEKLSRYSSIRIFFVLVVVIVTIQYLFNYTVYIKTTLLWSPSTYWKSLQNLSNSYLESTIPITTVEQQRNLSLCPIIPPGLQGHVTVNTQIPAWAQIEEDNPLVEPGGRYKPRDCIARHRVAIVLPFRDREIHLKLFLQNLHPFLQRQQLDYGIFVVEMATGVMFNRALLFNVGFVEAMKQYDYQCFIFHDVDLLPEDDRNLYTCPSMPRHMSTAIDRLKYKLPYAQIFGGVSAIRTDQYRKINGFSNCYFGWGGEDDDVYRRIINSNLTVVRYSNQVARYKMLIHKKASGNPQRFNLLRAARMRQNLDGLSSLKYKLIKLENKPLYTWILVSVDMKEVLNVSHASSKLGNLRKKEAIAIQILPKKVILNQPVKDNEQNGTRSRPATHQRTFERETVNKNYTSKVSISDRNKPRTIQWIPEEFNGTLPEHLTKFRTTEFVFKEVTKLKPKIQVAVARPKGGYNSRSSSLGKSNLGRLLGPKVHNINVKNPQQKKILPVVSQQHRNQHQKMHRLHSQTNLSRNGKS